MSTVLSIERTVTYACDQSRLFMNVSCFSYDSSACDYVREWTSELRRVLPYCVVFPTMINSHVRSRALHSPRGEEKKKESLSQYISHDYSRVYSMEIGITYLYPYDDDGNSNDSIFLSRRQGARLYARGYTRNFCIWRIEDYYHSISLLGFICMPSSPLSRFTYGHGRRLTF